jgi:hypothetical protein
MIAQETAQEITQEQVLKLLSGISSIRIHSQMKALGHRFRTLPAWLEAFDCTEKGEDDEDEAASQHEH